MHAAGITATCLNLFDANGPSQHAPFEFVEQDREQYYRATHIQAIKFQIVHLVFERIVGNQTGRSDLKTRVLRMQS